MAIASEEKNSRRRQIIDQVKAAGVTLIQHADDIVGWNAELISGLNISISIGIPVDGELEEAPEINVDKSFVSGRMARAALGEYVDVYDEGDDLYDD